MLIDRLFQRSPKYEIQIAKSKDVWNIVFAEMSRIAELGDLHSNQAWVKVSIQPRAYTALPG